MKAPCQTPHPRSRVQTSGRTGVSRGRDASRPGEALRPVAQSDPHPGPEVGGRRARRRRGRRRLIEQYEARSAALERLVGAAVYNTFNSNATSRRPNTPLPLPAAMTTRGGPAVAAACDQLPETGRANVSGGRLLGWIPSSLEDIRHIRRGGCSVVRRVRKALPANVWPPIRWRPIYLGFWYDSIVGKRWDGMVRGCRIGATDS
jgi:hypothetical protein